MKKWLLIKSPYSKKWRLLTTYEISGIEVVEFYSARIKQLEKKKAKSWRAIAEQFFFSGGTSTDSNGVPYVFETKWKLVALMKARQFNKAARKAEIVQLNDSFWSKLIAEY